jgi:hypothetical protein
MDNLETWQLIIGAIVPVGLVLLTQVFLPWYRSPRVAIEFENADPYCQHSPRNDNPSDPYWIRVKVLNKGRQTTGHIIAKLEEIRNSKYQLEALSKPMELCWSENEQLAFLRRREHEFLDILYVYPNTSIIRLRTKPEKVLDRSTYFLKIVVYADQAKPASAFYRIDWPEGKSSKISMEQIGWIRQKRLGLGSSQ